MTLFATTSPNKNPATRLPIHKNICKMAMVVMAKILPKIEQIKIMQTKKNTTTRKTSRKRGTTKKNSKTKPQHDIARHNGERVHEGAPI